MSVKSKPSTTVHAVGSKVSLTLCSLTSARICRMTSPLVPDLAEMLDTLSVVQIPMRVRFRGVTVREAALVRGPQGWGEFAPFPEYDDAEASRWLAAAVEAGWVGWPDPVRTSIPVNATVPAVPAREV